jgi:SAM-dependent methyltransferase
MRSFYQRLLQSVNLRLKLTREGQLRSFARYLPLVHGKCGLEIGGPSEIFRKGNRLPIYEVIGKLDNCDVSQSTEWANHSETFVFNPAKVPGKTFFRDGSALVDLANSTYDVILSSHNLEHFANPIKALKEWRRVLRPGGALVLVLPYYKDTFDNRRKPTPVDHMVKDFEQDVGEDDQTHLPEILELHDLSMDLRAGTREEFERRSMQNFANRCLHHHVFDERNIRQLLAKVGFRALSAEITVAPHLCVLAQMTPSRNDVDHH